MNTDNLTRKILSNTIIMFVIIVILVLIATYLSFKKIETYKFLIVINVITAIIIFVLLSVNDYYKSSTGYDLLPDEKTSGLDDQKIKYFNNIFDNPNVPQPNVPSNPGLGNPGLNNPGLGNPGLNNPGLISGGIMDEVDQQIENIIKEM